MMKTLTVAALMVAAGCPVAMAQSGPLERGRHAERMDHREGGHERRHREREERREERREMREMRMRGAGQTGFEIEIWPGRSLEVRCGDEPVADCAESMRPVLEALIAAPPPPMPGGPPPRHGPSPDGGPAAEGRPEPTSAPAGPNSGNGPSVDVPLPPEARDDAPPPPPESLTGAPTPPAPASGN